jgi:hypothetical protein
MVLRHRLASGSSVVEPKLFVSAPADFQKVLAPAPAPVPEPAMATATALQLHVSQILY